MTVRLSEKHGDVLICKQHYHGEARTEKKKGKGEESGVAN